MKNAIVLGFPDYSEQGSNLAVALDTRYAEVNVHHFPDGECKLTLPTDLPRHIVVCRSLHEPNSKLIELYLLANALRSQHCEKLTLVAPYLCYMRQDKAFSPGEVISQQWIGQFLGALYDEVITVDPHLHRVNNIELVIHTRRASALSASRLIGDYIAQKLKAPVIMGPDEESLQWVKRVAEPYGFEFCVAQKTRKTDSDVSINLPDINLRHRDIVLVDDVASTGNTLFETATLLAAQAPSSIFCAITHALFVEEAYPRLMGLGVKDVWSTDSISHISNKISLATLLADDIIL